MNYKAENQLKIGIMTLISSKEKKKHTQYSIVMCNIVMVNEWSVVEYLLVIIIPAHM